MPKQTYRQGMSDLLRRFDFVSPYIQCLQQKQWVLTGCLLPVIEVSAVLALNRFRFHITLLQLEVLRQLEAQGFGPAQTQLSLLRIDWALVAVLHHEPGNRTLEDIDPDFGQSGEYCHCTVAPASCEVNKAWGVQELSYFCSDHDPMRMQAEGRRQEAGGRRQEQPSRQ